MAERQDLVFIGVTDESFALAGALIALLIERRVLHPADLDLLLDRARELVADDAMKGTRPVQMDRWPLRR